MLLFIRAMNQHISIVIPVNRQEPELKQTLGTICPDCEIIVAGIKQKGVKRKYKHIDDEKRTRANLMNKGASLATKEIILFLHADTHISKNALKNIHNLEDEYVGGACSISFFPTSLLLKIVAFFANLRMKRLKIIYGDQSIFVRRSIFEKMNGYKDMLICEDIEFSKRLKKFGKLKYFNSVKTSSRRFLKVGTLRQIFRNILILILYHLGINDKKLKSIYLKT